MNEQWYIDNGYIRVDGLAASLLATVGSDLAAIAEYDDQGNACFDAGTLHLRDRHQIETRREHIPDCRQPRGWDWGTRIYPS